MDIAIGNKFIGKGHPVFIIAEAADSHYGNVQKAFEMIRMAKECGADCIKFQHHLPDEEMLPDIPMSDNFQEPLYEFLKKNALPLSAHAKLKEYCEKEGIIYLCTPFSVKAAYELSSIGVGVFKIGSGEFTDLSSLEKISLLGKPMILSCGMSLPEEISRTYKFLKKRGVPFCLMNCVSEYPPLYEDMNIGFIKSLIKDFPDVTIGHSDHTPDNFTAFAAVALGAKIIEKHITLDKSLSGPDASVSIDKAGLAQLVEGIRKIEAAMGEERKVHPREQQIRAWAFRSVVALRDIPAKTEITNKMLTTKRPGTGIPSCELPLFIGRRAKRFIKRNTLLRREDVA